MASTSLLRRASVARASQVAASLLRPAAPITGAAPQDARILSRRRACSTFQPPPNNAYHGTPVYNDVDLGSNEISAAAAARNADPEAVFVVTGASRSMGLQFVKELLARTKGRIVACVLRPGSAPALDSYLNTLSPDERERIEVHPLDVTDASQIQQLADDLAKTQGRVDGLFNVAGLASSAISGTADEDEGAHRGVRPAAGERAGDGLLPQYTVARRTRTHRGAPVGRNRCQPDPAAGRRSASWCG